ncbi:putative F-box domain-containing protein [Rosa chinensis]|uniref:Putative F-box domain-containing protein n=1 Tax=Rosa chinensis TaxID=74649 RepID=A0A2P6Q3X4_ROSCH|nr:putative F-box protein At5g15660 [Rosa chinensis]PRQ28854.1 putative F-box domain-containing protein [Rosa chinensis]
MADYLPEHVIVQIMERLPIKSLIRFTSVSKRWRFIILSDPNFAKSRFQQTRSRRVLLCHECEYDRMSFPCPDCPEPEFGSRDLETPWSTEDRKVRCPFKKPGDELQSLYSCNGLVCVTLYHRHCMEDLDIYIWNPSTQFFKKLPASPLQVQKSSKVLYAVMVLATCQPPATTKFSSHQTVSNTSSHRTLTFGKGSKSLSAFG